MKKPPSKDDLFLLVQSLEKAERRYFRLFSEMTRNTEPTSTMELFEVLSKMDQWDANLLKKEVEAFSWSSQLSTVKTRLFQHILKSLRLQYEGKQVEAQLWDQLEDLNLLHQRALYDAVAKRLKRLKKQSEKYRLPEILLKVQAWERRIAVHRPPKQALPFTRPAIEQMTFEANLEALHDHLRLQVRYHMADKRHFAKEVSDMLDSSFLTQIPPQSSLRAQILFCNANGLARLALGRPAAALPYYQQLFALWQKHPEWIGADSELYLSSLNNYLNCSLFILSLEEPPSFWEWTPPPGLRPEQRFRFERTLHSATLLYCLRSLDKKMLANRVPKVEKWLKRSRNKIALVHQLSMSYNLAILYFIQADFSVANRWILEVLNAPDRHIRMDLRRGLQLLQIVLQMEQGEWSLVENLLRNAKRRFRAEKLPAEQALLGLLHDYANAPSPHQQKTVWEQMDQMIFPKDNQALVKAAPCMVEIGYWVRSKKQRRPMTEIAREFQGQKG